MSNLILALAIFGIAFAIALILYMMYNIWEGGFKSVFT